MVDMNLDATNMNGGQEFSEVCFYIYATSNFRGSLGLTCMWPRAQLVIVKGFCGLMLIFLDPKARPKIAYPIPSTSSSSLSLLKLPEMVLYSSFRPTQ